MKLGWGSDHAGVGLKKQLMAYMEEKGYENVDYGNYDENDRDDDYPEFGRKVGEAVMRGEVDQGVLICGTGIGISLTANKVPGIRRMTPAAARDGEESAPLPCMNSKTFFPLPGSTAMEDVWRKL